MTDAKESVTWFPIEQASRDGARSPALGPD